MTASAPNRTHYAALDGLRGYAAGLIVVLHLVGAIMTEYLRIPEAQATVHSSLPGVPWLAFIADGHHGVEIFFVLSGFLMARLVDSRPSWGAFLMRRVRRIYPAFLVALVATTALACLAYGWEFKPRDFLLNLVFANALPQSGVLPYLHVSWTLGYEFAFYLLLPVLAFSSHRGVRIALAGAAALAVALWAPPPAMRMASLFTGFMLGCVADATIARWVRPIPMVAVLALYCAVVVSKVLGWLPTVYFFRALPVLLVLVVARVAFDEGLVGRVLGSRPMAWLGHHSYGIYLWHPAAISVAIYNLLPPSGLLPWPDAAIPFISTCVILMTLAVSAFSYRFIEQPFLRHRRSAPPVCEPRAAAVTLSP